MATMNLYIRKHIFSEQFNYEYFFNFFKVLEHDAVSTDLTNKLIHFFEMSNLFRNQALEVLHPMQGNTLKTYSKVGINYGFTTIGFLDHKIYKSVYSSLSFRENAVFATQDLYNEMGWILSPTRKVLVDVGEFNPETEKYENTNFSFDEIENLYDSTIDLSDE
jgi:hypothetical protein